MIEVDARQLKEAIESQHGGTATLAQSVPVRETFKGQLVWEGVVHVFEPERPSKGYARLCVVIAY
jgi:hypothetical protein